MTIPPTPSNPLSPLKLALQRMFRLRHRLRVGVPENIHSLKKRLFQNNKSNPVENVTDFDLFYNIGGLFAEQPESLTMGELSRGLNVPLSTATRIMDWLVNNGYAERLPDPEDRRVVRVALTTTGKSVYHEIDNFFLERLERLFRDFTPEEREQFHQLLVKMADTLEREV